MACRALTYISTLTTRAETPLYNALIGLSWGIGSILGPIVGGLLSASSATWRWVRDQIFSPGLKLILTVRNLGLLHQSPVWSPPPTCLHFPLSTAQSSARSHHQGKAR
jgi:MFS family permease